MAEFISQISRNAIWDFSSISNVSDQVKQDTLRDYFYNNNDNGIVNKILEFNKVFIYDLFTSLLYEFCNWFVQLFKEYFEKDDNLRILFRIYNSKEYKQICYQSKSNIELEEFNGGKLYNKDNLARNLKFDGIIKKSYEYNSSLVYSSNSWYNTFEPDRWKNYMCVIPTYEKMQLYVSGRWKEKIPYILCTISIQLDKNTIFLDILNYIEFKDCISDVISSFVNIFKLDFSLYCNYLVDKKII